MFNNIKFNPVKQKVILFKGGVNEEVNSIQLTAGELFTCVNYTEAGGKNSGYTSIKGYERFDGQTSPSSVAVDTYVDQGIDSYTELLLESDVNDDIRDKSAYEISVTNNGVTNSTARFSLGASSFHFDGTATIDTATISFNQDSCVEFWINYDSRFGTYNIIEKADCYNLYLEDGYLKLRASTDGIATDISLDADSYISSSVGWTHVACVIEGTEVRFYFNGEAQTTTATITDYPVDNSNTVTIGSGLIGYIEALRVSSTFRFPIDFTVPTEQYTSNSFYVEYVDDTAREAARAAITVVPGEDPVLGVVYFEGEVYAFRNTTPLGSIAKMYKATASGWSEVVQPVGYEFERDGVFKFSIYRFEGYNNNQPLLVITDGVSIPRVFDGTTITPLTSSELPDNQVTSPKYAAMSGAYNNRLYLGYNEGSVVFSNVGDPTSYTAIVGGTGELFLGDELTNIVEAPGNSLVLTCRNFIKILKDVEMNSSNVWSVMLETFSNISGAIASSAQALLGDVYFADDEGVTSLAAVDAYGNFKAGVISNKVQKSFLAGKTLITDSIVDRANNQYQLFFSDGSIFYFTFDVEKRVKGVTKALYTVPIMSVTTGEDSSGNVRKFFTSTGGFVYEMDIGTSFDGNEINTLLVTAYHNYGSPRTWKHFKRVVLELDAEKGLPMAYRTVFDYSEPTYPKTYLEEFVTKGISGVWGQDTWGSFSWGSSQVQRLVLYLRGSGANMGIELRTSSKYKNQHILHNGIVDYSIGSRQL